MLIVDVTQKIATELAEVEFTMRPSESKRWCESMAVVWDRSQCEIRYMVNEKKGEKVHVCYHAVRIEQIEEKFRKEFNL